VKDSCTHPGRYDELKSILNLIEKIQKNLNEFLDTKRQLFPRFYFLSDDEVLSIIGSSDPKNIQGYLQKMFDNISALDFIEQNSLFAQAMISLEKEQMNFLNPVECNGKVEVWMSNIEREMKESNRWITKEAIYYYRFKQKRLEWMRKYIGMVVLAVNQIWSTWEIEEYVEDLIKYE
jgi:dynein heavy chain